MKRLLIAAALIGLAPCSRASEAHNGFNMPCWWQDCYSSAGTGESIKRMAQTGAGWVALTPTWYQDGDTASVMKADQRTPTDDSLRAAIRNGLTPEQISEVLLQVGVYAGVPAANRAFAVAQRVLADSI